MTKRNFQQPLLLSSMPHDPSNKCNLDLGIKKSRNIPYYPWDSHCLLLLHNIFLEYIPHNISLQWQIPGVIWPCVRGGPRGGNVISNEGDPQTAIFLTARNAESDFNQGGAE